MDAARYARLKEIVFAASRLGGPERATFLDRECAGDHDLRREAGELLSDEVATADALRPHQTATSAAGAAPRSRAFAVPPLVGSYRLGAELGRGGMGVVFEATDERTGEQVAVKLLHPGLVRGEGSVDRFVREARAGTSVTHGGVVRTLDAGCDTSSGIELHWLVMERVEGRTLRRLLTDLGAVPEGLVREIARQCASALAAIHAAGIIHRDLKPENVLITDDQRIRIMDLGIAKVTGASATLTREGQFLGSVSHAAPEQLEGRDVGPAADLYSLGVTLHELAAGTNPFVRDSIGATLRAHLELVPPPLPGLSPFLAAVIGTLLEKAPERRIGSAAELARILVEREEGGWWRSRAARREACRCGVAVQRPTALVGRARELDELAQAWREAVAGRGSVVVLEGELGIGKTRLAAELADLTMADDALVVHAALADGEGAWPLGEAIAVALGSNAAEEIKRDLAPWPVLAAGLAALAGGAPAPPGGTADVLPAAMGRWLTAHGARRPVLVVVDDAEAADRDAAGAVRALARAAAESGALVIVSIGTDVRPGGAPALLPMVGARRLRLERLSRADVSRLVELALGSREIALRLAPRLMLRSDGVPAFALQLIRALHEAGALRCDEGDGQWRLADGAEDVELPAAARELLASRLARVVREPREVLDAASIHGLVFDAELVAAQLDRPVVRVLQDLADLERRHGLVRSEGRRHAFDCGLVLEMLREELPEALARAHHGRLADALQRRLPLGRAPEGRTAAEIAAHHLRGPSPEAAAPFVRASLEHLKSRNLNVELVAQSGLALEIGRALPADARVVALTLRARAFGVMGRRDEERETSAAAVAAAEPLGDPVLLADAVLSQGMQHWSAAEIDEAASCFEVAATLAREAGDHRAELRASRNLATALARQGRPEEAVRLHEWCRTRAGEVGDALTAAMATTNMSAVFVTRGDFERAHESYRDAVDLARQAGDSRIEAHAEGGFGLSALHLGRAEEAIEHALRQAELAREIGDRRSEVLGLSTAGLGALARGRLGEALSLIGRSIEIAEASRDPRGSAFVLGHVSEIRLALGDIAAAREALTEALELSRSIGHADVIAHQLLRMCRVADTDGDPEEMLALAREVLDLVNDDRTEPASVASAHVDVARACAALGRTDEALAALDEAERRTGGIRHPALRVSAALLRARLPGGDVPAAIGLVAKHEARLGVLERLAARHAAWKLTSDVAHLAEAHRLLEHLRAHAPAAWRDTMVERVAMHAEIARAWEARAAKMA